MRKVALSFLLVLLMSSPIFAVPGKYQFAPGSSGSITWGYRLDTALGTIWTVGSSPGTTDVGEAYIVNEPMAKDPSKIGKFVLEHSYSWWKTINSTLDVPIYHLYLIDTETGEMWVLMSSGAIKMADPAQ